MFTLNWSDPISRSVKERLDFREAEGIQIQPNLSLHLQEHIRTTGGSDFDILFTYVMCRRLSGVPYDPMVKNMKIFFKLTHLLWSFPAP